MTPTSGAGQHGVQRRGEERRGGGALGCGDRVSNVGAFEVVEADDERVEVGEFVDAFAVGVGGGEPHLLLTGGESVSSREPC